jgi:hypothetical protein
MEIELILKMAEKFDSEIMQKHRVKSSKSFLDGSAEENSSTDAILNFFEEIDYLLDKQSISTVAIWHYFSYWITGYYWATIDYRKEAGKSETDVFVFVGIERLYKKLLAIDKKNFNKARKTFKEHDLNDTNEFLKEEANLLGKPQRLRITKARFGGRAVVPTR